MINKKASGGITAFLNAGLIFALIYFIVFVVWGTGGGFKVLANVGHAMAQIPGLVWVIVGIIGVLMLLKK